MPLIWKVIYGVYKQRGGNFLGIKHGMSMIHSLLHSRLFRPATSHEASNECILTNKWKWSGSMESWSACWMNVNRDAPYASKYFCINFSPAPRSQCILSSHSTRSQFTSLASLELMTLWFPVLFSLALLCQWHRCYQSNHMTWASRACHRIASKRKMEFFYLNTKWRTDD